MEAGQLLMTIVQPKSCFKELKDLRPTFYGFDRCVQNITRSQISAGGRKWRGLVYYKCGKGRSFLGVCGDNRFTGDFCHGAKRTGIA